MRIVWAALVLISCAGNTTPDASVDAGEFEVDAGPRDPGFDIPADQWIDGGQGGSWGCMNRNRDRLIIRFETRDGSQMWRASLLLKRDADATLFLEFDAPDGFELTDARWALTCETLELANGELNHERTRPVHDLNGFVQLDGFVQGRPYKYLVDAGIRVAYRTYWMNQLGSLSETCAGP